MNVRLFVLAMILGVAGYADPVLGCSCLGNVGVGQHFMDAKVVFVGRATMIGLDVLPPNKHRPTREVTVVRFDVEKWYKGGRGKSVVVQTGMGGGDCGEDFRVGRSYVIFASGKRHHLATGICSGNMAYYVESPEVAELEEWARSHREK